MNVDIKMPLNEWICSAKIETYKCMYNVQIEIWGERERERERVFSSQYFSLTLHHFVEFNIYEAVNIKQFFSH